MLSRFLIIQFLLLAFLALASGYQIPDLSDSNWQTVLFLTPFGIVQNHLGPESPIRGFYSHVTQAHVEFSAFEIAALAAGYVGLVFNSIVFLKAERSGR